MKYKLMKKSIFNYTEANNTTPQKRAQEENL